MQQVRAKSSYKVDSVVVFKPECDLFYQFLYIFSSLSQFQVVIMSHWFTMVSVTMKQILLNVFMMVETVVDLLFPVSSFAFFIRKMK